MHLHLPDQGCDCTPQCLETDLKVMTILYRILFQVVFPLDLPTVILKITAVILQPLPWELSSSDFALFWKLQDPFLQKCVVFAVVEL